MKLLKLFLLVIVLIVVAYLYSYAQGWSQNWIEMVEKYQHKYSGQYQEPAKWEWRWLPETNGSLTVFKVQKPNPKLLLSSPLGWIYWQGWYRFYYWYLFELKLPV